MLIITLIIVYLKYLNIIQSGPTEDEIKYQQFEHIKELLEERNKFDTWILHEDPDEGT